MMTTSQPPEVSKNSKILIVGAGVFGLSTALHLLKRGYTNVHLFDRQPYDKNHYVVASGADAASADENKILRASYGGRKLYQDLAFKAMPEWHEWNKLLAKTPQEDLPPTLDPWTKLWHNSFFLRLSQNGLEQSEIDTQENFPAELRHTQYRVSNTKRRIDAVVDGIPETKIDPFERLPRGLPQDGYLDTTAGFVLASPACTFALHLLRKSPHVTTHLGPEHALTSIVKTTSSRVTGITTASGHTHDADIVLLATGGWTPSLLPETDRLLETTAGSVLNIQLPPSNWDLWEKFSPKNFPVWSWNMGTYAGPNDTVGERLGGLYGLPRTPSGLVKVAFRGAKWTSYTRKSGRSGEPLSYPRPDTHNAIPLEAMRVLRTFCATNLPDLLSLPVQSARLCWYTDSVDNDFLISAVPEMTGLFVASGGSGHGFKFLPVLGEHIVDVLEGKRTEYTDLFAWRVVPEGKRNGLEEGAEGWRNLQRQKMVGAEDWGKMDANDEVKRSRL